MDVEKYYVAKVQPMSTEIFAESKGKLDELARKDKERVELEAARNSVESYCYLIKNKLADHEDEVAKVSTEEQREQIRQLGADVTDWLDFEAYDADLETFRAKLKEMSEPAEKIWFRMNELTARPAAIVAMSDKLSKVEEILKKWETTMPQITEEERGEVLAKVDEIKKWMEEKLAEQETKQPHEDPAFSSDDVPLQSKSLERLMAKLSKKPKPKPVKKKDDADKAENATNAEGASKKEGSGNESISKEEATGADEKAADEETGKEETKSADAPSDTKDEKTQTNEKTDGDDEL